MYTLGELAEKVDAELVGDASCIIHSVATLANAKSGAISFLSNKRYRDQLATTKASAVIISAADKANLHTNGLIVKDPLVGYAKVATLLHPFVNRLTGVHPTAVVDEGARVDPSAWIGPCSVVSKGASIAANCFIGPGCFIGEDVSIGADSYLVANITLYHRTQVGARAIFHSGVVAGSDGFGFAHEKGKWLKIPQVGRLVIGDDVEIGANCAIDRGAIADTVIEDGVKIDNLVHIAHNVKIGAHSVIAGQVGIAGSATLGQHCALAGQVGINGHIEITDRVTITARGMVLQSITEPGTYSSGIPADTNLRWRKNVARFKQLDEMAKAIKHLQVLIEQKISES